MKYLLWKSGFVILMTIFVIFFNIASADDNASTDNIATNNNAPQFSCTLSDQKSDGVIGEAKDTFTKSTPKIYLSCYSDQISKGEKIKAEWIADDTHNVAPPNYLIDQKEVDVTPNTDTSQGVTANFSLSKPTKGWPLGSYHVELYVDGDLDQSVKFNVK